MNVKTSSIIGQTSPDATKSIPRQNLGNYSNSHPSRRRPRPRLCQRWQRRCWQVCPCCPVRSGECQAWRCALAAPYGGTHFQAPCALSCLSTGQSSCKSHTRLKSRQMAIRSVMLATKPLRNEWNQKEILKRGLRSLRPGFKTILTQLDWCIFERLNTRFDSLLSFLVDSSCLQRNTQNRAHVCPISGGVLRNPTGGMNTTQLRQLLLRLLQWKIRQLKTNQFLMKGHLINLQIHDINIFCEPREQRE